jgi:hypothetical protein
MLPYRDGGKGSNPARIIFLISSFGGISGVKALIERLDSRILSRAAFSSLVNCRAYAINNAVQSACI